MDNLIRIFKSVANGKRVRMLNLLDRKSERTISDLADELRLPYQTVARNLSILSNAGLVKVRTHYGVAHYSINRDERQKYAWRILATIADYYKERK